jgi:hypothetical protein
MDEFANDSIITFLLNNFPSDKKTEEKFVEKYSESSMPQVERPDKTFLSTLSDFFKKYWFIIFVLFLILSFVLWKRFFKN